MSLPYESLTFRDRRVEPQTPRRGDRYPSAVAAHAHLHPPCGLVAHRPNLIIVGLYVTAEALIEDGTHRE